MTHTIHAHFAEGFEGKTVVARLLPGTDLLSGIEEVCRANQMQYATISSCFGSLKKAGYVYLVEKPETSIGAGYGELISRNGPIEFLNGTGIVCQRDDQFETHIHGTMCDKNGAVFGGHLIKGENTVLTVDLVLKEIKNMTVLRTFDPETGGYQLYPIANGKSEPVYLEIKGKK
ncbi:PPC domain-containing DNA-binding protein [Bacillus mesophilum]|uniref:DNA-binding protein n=1 Tax=Bacillus mesophilum TaxID=1071718 RepID=A0A7V7RLY0_9BACI|nr:PPC domain-containing DNA-binding protein [Bacillus mesophilum]KAB2332830.1 DNA-binding protein [Bacillus mesophilum]